MADDLRDDISTSLVDEERDIYIPECIISEEYISIETNKAQSLAQSENISKSKSDDGNRNESAVLNQREFAKPEQSSPTQGKSNRDYCSEKTIDEDDRRKYTEDLYFDADKKPSVHTEKIISHKTSEDRFIYPDLNKTAETQRTTQSERKPVPLETKKEQTLTKSQKLTQANKGDVNRFSKSGNNIVKSIKDGKSCVLREKSYRDLQPEKNVQANDRSESTKEYSFDEVHKKQRFSVPKLYSQKPAEDSFEKTDFSKIPRTHDHRFSKKEYTPLATNIAKSFAKPENIPKSGEDSANRYFDALFNDGQPTKHEKSHELSSKCPRDLQPKKTILRSDRSISAKNIYVDEFETKPSVPLKFITRKTTDETFQNKDSNKIPKPLDSAMYEKEVVQNTIGEGKRHDISNNSYIHGLEHSFEKATLKPSYEGLSRFSSLSLSPYCTGHRRNHNQGQQSRIRECNAIQWKERYKHDWNKTIYLVQSDITTLPVDAIIISVYFNGGIECSRMGLAQHIDNKAGPIVTEEYSRSKDRQQMPSTLVTCAGNLPCNIIIHAAVDIVKLKSKRKEVIQEKILDCLNRTSDKGYNTIAIPALFTNVLDKGIESPIVLIAKSVKMYFDTNPITSITDVYFCDKNENNITEFQTVLKDMYPAVRPLSCFMNRRK